jgi:hypothetical protein
MKICLKFFGSGFVIVFGPIWQNFLGHLLFWAFFALFGTKTKLLIYNYL